MEQISKKIVLKLFFIFFVFLHLRCGEQKRDIEEVQPFPKSIEDAPKENKDEKSFETPLPVDENGRSTSRLKTSVENIDTTIYRLSKIINLRRSSDSIPNFKLDLLIVGSRLMYRGLSEQDSRVSIDSIYKNISNKGAPTYYFNKNHRDRLYFLDKNTIIISRFYPDGGSEYYEKIGKVGNASE